MCYAFIKNSVRVNVVCFFNAMNNTYDLYIILYTPVFYRLYFMLRDMCFSKYCLLTNMGTIKDPLLERRFLSPIVQLPVVPIAVVVFVVALAVVVVVQLPVAQPT